MKKLYINTDASLSVGGEGQKTMTPDNLIEEVRQQSAVGKQIIESQLFFLRSLKDLPVETTCSMSFILV